MNSEAMIVDPITGDLIIFEKKSQSSDPGGLARIFRAPASSLKNGSTVTMQHVGDFNPPTGGGNAITAADISADGTQVAIRTYNEVYLWNRNVAQPVLGASYGVYALPTDGRLELHALAAGLPRHTG